MISLGEEELTMKESIKYLGVVLDQGLYWHPHIDHYRGDDSLGSKLGRGVMFFLGASKTHLSAMGGICFSAIRVALGCMPSTPIAILLSEAGMTHPDLVRTEMAAQQIMRSTQWNNKAAMTAVTDLSSVLREGQRKVALERSGLFRAFRSVEGVTKMIASRTLPSGQDLS